MSSRIRIHVYFGTLCKSEVLDTKHSFAKNFSNILTNLGISADHHKRYVMKLTNGGVVEKNEVLFHDDRVIVILKDDIIPIL